MRAILSPSPPPLPLLLRGNRARPSLPRCVYRPENAAGGGSFFPGGIGTSRADWQSSCAILASKVLATGQQQNQGGAGAGAGTFLSAGDDTHQSSDAAGPPPTVNGQKVVSSSSSSSSATLDLVHVDPNLPRQFSVADLSPAPMHGSQVRVAYQGVPGAYSEAAAGKAYPGCEAIPCDQFEVVFQAVELWIADRAVLPVENSLGGSIHRNYDLLLRHRLHIVGEVQLPVHHCLLALPGVRPEHLTRVISHPQALSQCEHTLTAMGLRVAREAVYDTAGAAEMVAARGLRDTGAIASARAGELYGLEVVADGVQDEVGNVTRFVMVAREPIVPRTDRRFKTSIVFGQGREGTSVLFKVLSALAFRGIGLSKIESRPHRGRPIRVVDDANLGGSAMHFEYMFYVDFEASLAESRAQNALAEIHEFTSFLRVLGSYPMDLSPCGPPPAPAPAPAPAG